MRPLLPLLIGLTLLLCSESPNILDTTREDYRVPSFSIASQLSTISNGDTTADSTVQIVLQGNNSANIFRYRYNSDTWTPWSGQEEHYYTLKITDITEGEHHLAIQTAYHAEGQITDSTFSFTRVVAPKITHQSAQQILLQTGHPCILWVSATGTAPLHYQWFKRQQLIQNATNDTLIIEAFTAASDSGSYRCNVQNSWGMDSTKAILLLPRTTTHLSSLQSPAGTRIEGFDSLTTRYTILKSFEDSIVTITAESANPQAIIAILHDEAPLRGPLTLPVGTDSLTVHVHSPETIPTVYTVLFQRAAGDYAALKDISIEGFTLANPPFSESVERYELTTNFSTQQLTVRPTAATDAMQSALYHGDTLLEQGVWSLSADVDSISIVATAPNGVSTKTYWLIVTRSANTAPTANPVATASLIEDAGRQTITLTGSDAENQSLRYKIIAHPTKVLLSADSGSLADSAAVLSLTPILDICGNDNFTFVILDSENATSNQVQVNIAIACQNDAPVAADTAIAVNEDDSVTFRLPVFDTDGDKLLPMVTEGNNAAMATLVVPNNFVDASQLWVSYKPKRDKSGRDQFRYKVSDGLLSSREVSLSIEIRPVDDRPTIQILSPANGVTKVEPATAMLSYYSQDVDGDDISHTIIVSEDSASIFSSPIKKSGIIPQSYPLSGMGALNAGTKYYWTIIAQDNSNQALKDTSEIASFFTKNALPVWKTMPAPRDTSQYTFYWPLNSLCSSAGGGLLQFSVNGAGASIKSGTDTLMFIANNQLIELTALDTSIPGDEVSRTTHFTTGSFVPAGMKLVAAKNKVFTMGAELVDMPGARPHQVTLTHNYFMDSTEVTQRDYLRLTGQNPSYHRGSENNPVEYLSWFDAVYYCNARSKQAGLDTVYTYTAIEGTPGYRCTLKDIAIRYDIRGFRLPTEAEWEFACRGGTTTDYYWGNSRAADTAKLYAWYNLNANSKDWTEPHAQQSGAQPVALKLPNSFGLYDMGGNVVEWCNDWYSDYQGAETNPSGPDTGATRIYRGGSWVFNEWWCGSAIRGSESPSRAFTNAGFRCVYQQ